MTPRWRGSLCVCQFATRDSLPHHHPDKKRPHVSRVHSFDTSRPSLLDLPPELIEHVIRSIADGLALLPYRLVSHLFNNFVLCYAFNNFCPRTPIKFTALLWLCRRPRQQGGPPRVKRLAFPSQAEAMGIRSQEVIELLELTTQLRSLATSWLFDLDTLQTIPRAFAGLRHLCVYMECSMRQVAWCMQLKRLQSLVISEVRAEEEPGIVAWMKDHQATSSIVKMRIKLQGDVLTDGFCHLLRTPCALEGLTVIATSNVILQLITSADEILHQHKSTLSALSLDCFNRRQGPGLTPTVGSTLWFTEFPMLRQLSLCCSHLSALYGFCTTPNFLRMMVHSPLERLVLKGSWAPEPDGSLYRSLLDLIQSRTITSSVILWTSSVHADDVAGLLASCNEHDIELTFWDYRDQYPCLA
jgi:hypothetical protein